jgi:uncharacterized protein (TIGR03437 family)
MVSRKLLILDLSVAAFLTSCGQLRPVAAIPIAPRPAAAGEDEHADHALEAAEFFREERTTGEDLPLERYADAMRHARTMRRYSLHEGRFIDALAPAPAVGIGAWKSLGPGNIGGRTRALAIHPKTPNVMWAAGASGGIWKTLDAGASWTPQTDLIPVLTFNTLVIDSTNPATLYAGSGESTQNMRGAGIFKTTDGGQTWPQLPATATSDFYFVNKLAISPANPAHLFAATSTGIWASFDAGATWKKSYASTGCFDLALPSGQLADVVFATCLPVGILRNLDAGGDGPWGTVLADTQLGYTALAVAPSQPSTIYAVSITTNSKPFNLSLNAVYRSQSNGDPGSWVARASNQDSNRLNAGILSKDAAYSFPNPFCNGPSPDFTGQGSYNLTIAVDPVNPNRVWVGGIGLFRSDDGGANWGYAFLSLHPDQHAIVFHPNYDGAANQILYSLNDGGIYRTTQAAGSTATCTSQRTSVTWTDLNNGYGTTQFYHGVPYPGGGAYFGGTQDNGTVRGTDSTGPNQWTQVYGGDGGFSRVDPLDASTLYFEYVNLSLVKSTDGGANYAPATKGITEASTNFPFITFYTFDPNDSLRLYIGGSQLWRSEDGGASWSAASASVSPTPGAIQIRRIAVSPADSNLVLFGDNSGVIYRNAAALSATGSTTWTGKELRPGTVSAIAFDSRHPSTVYATYTTFNNATGNQHVYKSIDGGLNWKGIDGTGATGLPDIPVDSILVDPDDSNRIYLGTDIGVFASLDGGNTWVRDDNPFANAITTNLVIDRTNGIKTLYAFTYGRGVWRVSLASGAPCSYSVSPTSLVLDASLTGSVNVLTSPGCPWSAVPEGDVVLQPPAGGVGSGVLALTMSQSFNSAPMLGSFSVQGQVVTVAGPATPFNGFPADEPSNAVPIPALPFQSLFNNNSLTRGTNDPPHSCTNASDFKTGWWKFTAASTGFAQLTAKGGREDAFGNSGIVLTAYPLQGGTLGSELACAVVPQDTNPFRTGTITFPVTAGTTYLLEISAASGNASANALIPFFVSMTPPPASLTVTPAASANLTAGDTRQFTASLSNAVSPAVRWSVSPPIGVITPDGLYTAGTVVAAQQVTITAQSVSNPAARAGATVVVVPPPPPLVTVTGVTNAASFQTGGVAPGEIVTLFGSGIGPAVLAGAQLDTQGKLATSLAGTQVLFDGIAAPLVYVSAGQTSAIVPYGIAGQSTTQVVVVHNSDRSLPQTLQVAATSPALFTADSSGAGPVAALNENGSFNSQTPAPRASIVVFFGTGEGQTNPAGVDGQIANTTFPAPEASVSVSIGGIPARIRYAGAAPQEVAGLMQFNVEIPLGVKSGPNVLLVKIGQAVSRTGVTVQVE